MFKKAGPRPENPPVKTYDEFLATYKKMVDSKAAPAAIAPRRRMSSSSPGSTSTRCTPPSPVASRRSRTARRPSTTRPARTSGTSGRDVQERLHPAGEVRRDSFADKKGRDGRGRSVGDRGLQGQGRTGVPCRCRPKEGMDAERDPHLHRREEHRALLGVREPEDRVGRPEVRHQRGPGRQAPRDHRPDADPRGPARRRTPTTSPRTRTTRRSPTRPRAPSRCPTCPTRWRSGRRSATTSPPR